MKLKEEVDEEKIIKESEKTLRLLRKQAQEFLKLRKKLEALR